MKKTIFKVLALAAVIGMAGASLQACGSSSTTSSSSSSSSSSSTVTYTLQGSDGT